MSCPIKHECGIALVRLRKPLSYFQEKYGTAHYGLDKLYLLMEKQHNRGQEGAGVSAVKLNPTPGSEYVFRERATGNDAIQKVFQSIGNEIERAKIEGVAPGASIPYETELYLGHLRYSTTGRHGITYTQPLLRRNNFRNRSLTLAGNFNLTNIDEVFSQLIEQNQHPRMYADTYLMLEAMGYSLDRHTAYGNEPDLAKVIREGSSNWDGGYCVCGIIGSGHAYVHRDPWGIRPCFYYIDDEVVVVASERPVIQTVFGVSIDAVKELPHGNALIIDPQGGVSFDVIHEPREKAACSFERIYFSRGGDADIYQERKQLGRSLVPAILSAVDHDIDNTVLSFIPNTAETAFYGMIDGFDAELNRQKSQQILVQMAKAVAAGDQAVSEDAVRSILSRKVRIEKVAIKDIKLRTFIAQESGRNELAAHVYDITYGSVRADKDNLVVIDDSIVRGTTLRQSIIKMLDRLSPRHIVIVSSSPQVRYPDCYGIDMSMLSEFAAFRAAIALLKENGMGNKIQETLDACLAQTNNPYPINEVKRIYEPFTDQQVSDKMAQMLTPNGTKATVSLIFQTVDGLHKACPNHKGDWYFTGDYPTPGGNRLVNEAFINWVEGHEQRSR